MSMGKRREKQEDLFVPTSGLESPGHPFYDRLDRLLVEGGFDALVERTCAPYYASDGNGRPSLPPGTYFRLLFVGYFEGIASERELSWRCADSLSIRSFLGLSLSERVPNHSTLSVIRDRLDAHVFDDVFRFVLELVDKAGLLKGKEIGVDSTQVEANASMRTIERKDSGKGYQEYIRDLAAGEQAASAPKPSQEDAQRSDRKRPKRTSNRDWQSKSDPDARIARMKDHTTRLAHKPEHAVDLESGVILALTMNASDQSDHATLPETLDELEANLEHLDRDLDGIRLVADKGYYSDAALKRCEDEGMTAYISEPKLATKRNWRRRQDASEAKQRCYKNRRRTKSRRGRKLMKQRASETERPFADLKRRCRWDHLHLRGRESIWKRYLVHGAALNLSLVMRAIYGAATPKTLDRLHGALSRAIQSLQVAIRVFGVSQPARSIASRARNGCIQPRRILRPRASRPVFSTPS